ncbi:uncharacterized protein AKAW2_60995A [Aspergillus luchuensis]|uniref:Uncharacterized protein n=1 Tax=Aspergillus kawachii TaxID=1069201 RepID=A0A7R7WGS9_ASPKA|nr:uncharacterized protein AKAW2_60995A [Aspergillus luchuensis]BCS02731.1 hypothetical protein AKAW2_60995A [Aspergillus luchuensis]
MSDPDAKKKTEEVEKDSWAGSFALPETQDDWKMLEKLGKLKNSTLHSIKKMASGSKVLRKQFVMFWTIWPFPRPRDQFYQRIFEYGIDDATLKQAIAVVDGSKEFKRYLALIEAKIPADNLVESDGPAPLCPSYAIRRT